MNGKPNGRLWMWIATHLLAVLFTGGGAWVVVGGGVPEAKVASMINTLAPVAVEKKVTDQRLGYLETAVTRISADLPVLDRKMERVITILEQRGM